MNNSVRVRNFSHTACNTAHKPNSIVTQNFLDLTCNLRLTGVSDHGAAIPAVISRQSATRVTRYFSKHTRTYKHAYRPTNTPRLLEPEGSRSGAFSRSLCTPLKMFMRLMAVQARGMRYFPSLSQHATAADLSFSRF